jgi:phosphatidylserine/phosphatidylglycerophosphate/cardiolipin synthase-like enzyme
MAKFLTTSGISYEIERTLKSAQRTLVLISPVLKVSDILLERLRDADRRGFEITIVYGKSELAHSEEERLRQIDNLKLFYLGNLHAKCYLNETRAVVGSMNMYEFSEKNNREAGILITEEYDREAFGELVDESDSIVNNAEIKSGARSLRQDSRQGRPSQDRSSDFSSAYCIRCGCGVWADPARPHCRECYEVWAEWGNEDYTERFCHGCGESVPTTRAYPFCSSCGYKHRRGTL